MPMTQEHPCMSRIHALRGIRHVSAATHERCCATADVGCCTLLGHQLMMPEVKFAAKLTWAHCRNTACQGSKSVGSSRLLT